MNLHKNFPISQRTLEKILIDIRKLYPESDAIYLAGTYARVNETPSPKKGHDIDIVIHFPTSVNKRVIELRNDDALWNKWSHVKSKKPIIDFLFMFGKDVPHYGQHQWRISEGLETPRIILWRK
jgi:predicted nucleotidyltransferase